MEALITEKRKSTDKIISDYNVLAKVVEGLRAAKYKIAVTIGSWDLLHIGHVRYLLKAKDHGDILIVGIDTDRAIKLYKGPLRPVVPEDERSEMLSYQSCVDFITPIDDLNKKGEWQYGLIKRIRPDVFIAVEGSYPKKQLKDMQKYCKKVTVLPRQAQNTSTTKMIQNTVKKNLEEMHSLLDKRK